MPTRTDITRDGAFTALNKGMREICNSLGVMHHKKVAKAMQYLWLVAGPDNDPPKD